MNNQNPGQHFDSDGLEGKLKRGVSRRDFLRMGGLTVASVGGLLVLGGCGSSSSSTDSGSSSSTIRIGMEAAYAPYNWQTSTASDYTIPIDNVSGAYADGYDVQIAKKVCEALGGDPVAEKMSFSGLVDALNNEQIDLIIAGMTATDERRQSIDFSDPYFTGSFGLFVMEGSSYEGATSLADFSGASVLGQKDTMLDTVIDDIPNVNHLTPVESVPNMMSHLTQGTCDAITYNVENEAGYIKANPGIVAIKFADGQGFQEKVTANVGIKKGNDDKLATINSTLASMSASDLQTIWDAVIDRQPE
ncbi:MAG: transporter substrate-binding domain-containing protein [Atopobiaceae bacterium]|jgi:ABC-type amino acid transport substrate-binding protein|nr:transporter substrate-binding domain-containing protein [Atopobiaceae bacterium]MCI2174105.1 transporter substrate-binding domain-containing protein [Atopobiaceae bacterium]MCI2206746.1 transporter substrate-binding domain-containing protein [Atopobiaceae bacterium]